MPLAVGDRLGPYEVLGWLGAGGMGEVYTARDTRLGRSVAIKILPNGASADPTALARFDREARAVAALSHPNIVALYDVGRDGATGYTVSELLDGQTLRERLKRGAVPVRSAVAYARDIADALATAHERGIVHRDLKPENVFLTAEGRIKVLDFGLAHVTTTGGGSSPAAPVADASTTLATTPGLVVGTVGYMAPEQVRGQAIDARTDIFALGAVLYELLTGQRAFSGKSPADTMSAILNADPPEMSSASGMLSPALDRVVRRCLEKVPAQRFQSARDLAFALEAIGLGSTERAVAVAQARPRRRGIVAALSGLVALLATAVGAFVLGRQEVRTPEQGPTGRFVVSTGGTVSASSLIAVSPDGNHLVYHGASSGQGPSMAMPLLIRRLDELGARPLDGVPPTAVGLFWSPDSRTLGYFAETGLYALSMQGGTARRVADFPERPYAGTWGTRDTIVVGTSEGLYRVPAAGGTPVKVLEARTEEGLRRVWPSFLPDGERFLFNVVSGRDDAASETHAATVDGRDLGVVHRGGVGTRYADGHLVFGAQGSLYAQPFDLGRLATSGDTYQLGMGIRQNWRSGSLFASASETGVLAYRSAMRADVRFTWFDRNGHELSVVNASGAYTNFDVSPDGTRIATTRRDELTGANDLWLIDAVRGVASLAAPQGSGGYGDPTWSPDGHHLAYRYQQQMVIRPADGGAHRVLQPVVGFPDSFSRDGRFLVYGTARGRFYELWALDLTSADAPPIPLVTGVTLADEGRVAPSGRWIAYHSTEAGTAQVFVIRFPPTGQKWQVSQAGGVQPRWSRDGQELFYLDLEGRLMSVVMPDSDPQRAAAPQVLFSTGLAVSNAFDQFAPVGDRFLLRVPLRSSNEGWPVEVLVNWARRPRD